MVVFFSLSFKFWLSVVASLYCPRPLLLTDRLNSGHLKPSAPPRGRVWVSWGRGPWHGSWGSGPRLRLFSALMSGLQPLLMQLSRPPVQPPHRAALLPTMSVLSKHLHLASWHLMLAGDTFIPQTGFNKFELQGKESKSDLVSALTPLGQQCPTERFVTVVVLSVCATHSHSH